MGIFHLLYCNKQIFGGGWGVARKASYASKDCRQSLRLYTIN